MTSLIPLNLSSKIPENSEFQLRPIVVSGPSGSGKSTLLKRLFQDYPDKFGFSVSHTTRSPRPGEIDNVHYHFVTREKFKELIEKNYFLEYTEFSNNLYGTSIAAVKEVAQQGKFCILDIELEGVKLVKKTDLNARFVFIAPPSLEVLEKRLRDRGTESEDAIQARLDAAKKELAYAAEEGSHDLIVVNDNLDKSSNSIVSSFPIKISNPRLDDGNTGKRCI
ncbi:5204_t:CDS:2 [Diversispora eburnea]|uniref:Guanylate kinase n=1 Tax=Diversispora eburnea TaxID=1213867 RepID=A0A9N8VUN2_9GLOM|nr:5204_t:CDS:2 [Diversispora eburnea]